MKKLLLIVLSILLYQALYSQTIQWEKAYNLFGFDYADGIIPVGTTGSYMVSGTTCKYGQVPCGYRGLFISKLNSSGDTVWVKDLNVATTNSMLYPISNKGMIVVANGTYFDYLVHVLKLDSNGVVLAHYTIDEVSVSAGVLYSNRIKVLPDGDLLIVGQTLGSSVSGMIHDAFVTRMSGTGIVKWTRYYNLGYYTEGYYVEGMANGHYWVSGSAYSDIWGMELDTSGNVVREHIFYSTPTYAKINAGYVQQFVNQQYIVTMSNIGSPTKKFYVGLYDKNYVKKWGHEELGGIQLPHITSDSSVVIAGAQVPPNGTVSKALLRKISIDSSIVWNNYYTSVYNNTAVVSNIAFTGDGDAVFAGYIDSPYPTVYDLYFMKVGGIGLPYLPETDSSWLVTSSKPIISSSSKVSVYPNPAREVLHIESSGVTGVLSVTLENVLGKAMYEGEMSESSTLSLSGYARGLYFLRVRAGSSLLLEQKVLITE